jgi:hypothetical protein
MPTLPPIAIPIIAAVALAQWLVFACISLFSRKSRGLMPSSALFAFAWLAIFGAPLMAHTKTTQASAMSGGVTHGSCASVEPGMSAADLTAKVGQPDEKRPNDEARGPGATIWIYRDSRCAVHLFDGKVEALD